MERKRRGVSEKFLIKGSVTKKPSDWKQFLMNDENEKQFTNLLLTEWQKNIYASELLTSEDTNTRIILYCM